MSIQTRDGYNVAKGSKYNFLHDGSCYQRAIANATGESFDTIYKESVAVGIKKLGKGGSSPRLYKMKHRPAGIGMRGEGGIWSMLRASARISKTRVGAWSYCTPKRGTYTWSTHDKKTTLNQFVKLHPRGTFVVFVRAHALTVKDGVVFDNGDRVSGRHYVREVLQFVRALKAPQPDKDRETLRGQLDHQAVTLDANFKIHTGRSFDFTNIETTEMVLDMRAELRVPVKVWLMAQRHGLALKAFGPLF